MAMYDDYEPVADRLAKWWTNNPNGRVLTSYEWDGTAWIFRAELFRDVGDSTAGIAAASGYARQELLEQPPNKRDGSPNYSAPEWTSPVEVCETSAIGRALANLGYQAKKGASGRPSREEMSTQSRNEYEPKLPDYTNGVKNIILDMVNRDKKMAAALWTQLAVVEPITTKQGRDETIEAAKDLTAAEPEVDTGRPRDSRSVSLDDAGRPF